MGSGLLKSFVLLADEDGRQDSLSNSCLAAAVLGTQDSFLKECDDYAKHSEVQMQAIRQEFHETSEKLKKMSDEELIECVFSFGTTFFLDGVILKAGTLAATVEGRALLNQCAEALNSPFAKEYVLEAVGVGKLTLEEGADIANMAIEVVEKNPELFTETSNLSQIIKNCSRFSSELKSGSNNFTFSFEVTSEEARRLGNGWVGDGAKLISNGEGIVSEIMTPDYILQRTFRFPTAKSNGIHKGKIIANFQERIRVNSNCPWQEVKNGHLIIK